MLDRRTLLSRFLGCLGLGTLPVSAEIFKIQLTEKDVNKLQPGFWPIDIDRLKLAPNVIVGESVDNLTWLMWRMQQLKETGGNYIITVSTDGDIIDGSRHVYCARKLGWTTVMCQVVYGPEMGGYSLDRWRRAYHVPNILPKLVWRHNWIAA